MLHPAIDVRKKGAIEGYGLFATSPISKETLIWKLSEPSFTQADINTWQGEKLSAFKRYGFQCGINRFSLPTGKSREMNHSCDPNTWWSSCDTIIARRSIASGEEITYDYSSCDIDLEFNMVCQCSSSFCRGIISNLDYLDLDWQKQYGPNLPSHVLTAVKKATSL